MIPCPERKKKPYEDPAQLASLATGTVEEWRGTALVQGESIENFYLQVGINGGLDGVIGSASDGCRLSGTATPRETRNVFDLSVSVASQGGANRPQEGETLAGVAFAIAQDIDQDGLYGAVRGNGGHLLYAFRAPERFLVY